MSSAVFPSLVGLSWPFVRTPIWKTGIQPTQSGRELRAAYMSYPLYNWSSTYDVLRTAVAFSELQTLVAFFNTRQGSFDSFLFADPDDNSVTDQPFGTGDGVTTAFQLVKAFGGYVEPVLATNVITNVKVNGTPTGAYTLNAMTGILTFTVAPAAAATLTWTGTFYYQCRFLSDTIDLSKFMSGLYEAKKIEFKSIKL